MDLKTSIRTIQACQPAQQMAAFDVLLRDLTLEQRRHQVARLSETIVQRGEVPSGLFVALADGLPVAACWAQVQAGRTAVLWLPRLAAGEPEETARRLVASATTLCDSLDLTLVQALLAPEERREADWLQSSGYRYLTDLVYMVCLPRPHRASLAASGIEFEVYSPANHARLAEVMRRSYIDTFDCPELDGLRSIDDTLAGYRSTGQFHPSRWMVLRHEGRDVGCLLLAAYPEQNQWELVYLGLLPEARGKGLGMEATRFAGQLALGSGASRLVLAVDARNEPAQRMYERAGFMGMGQRAVWVRRV